VAKGRSARRVMAVLAIAGLGLALTACGDDDDDAAPAAEADDGGDATAEENDNGDNNDDGDNAEADDNGDNDDGDNAEADDNDDNDNGDDAEDNGDNGDGGETIEVDDINDIPDECLDLMGDMLEQIEPIVEDVDWENADLSSMQSVTEELDAEFSGMDDEMESAGCDQYELSEDANMDALIDLAQDRAPGTVAYFEFIQRLQEGFSEITIPDVSVPEGDDGEIDLGDTGDVPQDCDGAIGYVEDLMDKYESMMDMPVNELSTVGAATTVITTKCSANEMNDFVSDPDVTAWMSAN
jgi:hypothetical protein